MIAPATSRFEVARLAARQLLRRNAAVVFASVDQSEVTEPVSPLSASSGAQIAQRTRWTPTRLSLANTFDATLAQLGTRTRRNLRYYRRRAMAELGAQFVPSVQLSRNEFLALNRASTHPLPDDEARWRYELLDKSSAQPNTLFAGMRAANGDWLSLIWGHRHDRMTRVHWQLNRAAEPHHSLCIAMRSFLLEHEIANGALELHLIGGTQQPIRASCVQTPVTDLLAVRNGSLRGWLLRRFAQRLLPSANFLRGALEDQSMEWAGESREWTGASRAA